MPRTEVVLGVDIGGKTTVFGYVDRSGRIIVDAATPTHAHQTAAVFFERLHESAQALIQRADEGCELFGIGISAHHANYFKSTIESPPNLSWDFVDVGEEIKKYYCNVPVALTNGANAAALGEMLFGAARGMRDFIVVTLGAYLSGGIVANSELVYGADSFAGEIGHTIVDPNGRECNCGRKGCLETYLSASGICRTVQELICNRSEPSQLRRIDYEHLTFRRIFEAAQQGDRLALEAFETSGQILGMKLADSVAHTGPEAIILVGALAEVGDLIFKPTKRSLEVHLLGVYKDKVRLLPSGLAQGKREILGASAVIWNALGKTAKRKDLIAAASG
jgi:glucokinase